MYNSIYPININYRKNNPYYSKPKGDDTNAQNPSINNGNRQTPDTFPNGAKVAIDYTRGQINISQVLADFRNTIIAINAPDDIRDEINIYLNLVDKESKKENPSRDIVISNLRNASKISDDYIAKTLGKPSNVVEGWINTLFLQQINLKADPNEINPDFLLEFPQKAQEKIDAANAQKKEDIIPQTEEQTPLEITEDSYGTPKTPKQEAVIQSENSFELSHEQTPITPITTYEIKKSAFSAVNEADKKAKALFVQAKKLPKTQKGNTEALNILNEALGILSDQADINENIRAALHLERGKIFDNYDYVDYALRDYWEATRADDLNLKANAFYKTGQIYDEFAEFSPALDNYLSSVAYSGEADNFEAQSRVLTKISSLYAKQFDLDKTKDYSELALDSAHNANSDKLVADTYSQNAQNMQYLGENDTALDNYKNALRLFPHDEESYEQIAYNYEQASIVMEKLGNTLKAAKLQSKALLYYQKAQLQKNELEQAS